MKEINKSDYYKKFAHVSVNQMIMSNTSKCCECKSKLQNFTVFIGEDQRLSTLYTSCCNECLPIVVKKACEEGIKEAENQISRAEQRLYKESLELVRKTKLNHLEDVK